MQINKLYARKKQLLSPLLQWLSLTQKGDPNAPLWCPLANGRIGERLCSQTNPPKHPNMPNIP